ncbi:hypothetical protein CB3_032 [Pectobacterium phage vB_PatP_CB3]|uniref:Uncharacterized protein n=3 Tax=Cbunavirus TaxID=2842586 RepID=A0A2P0PAM2_9CAUD|nr:hypothetical protein HWB08_gp29 [Pectobacterium phage vB_PatP_CB1]YP_009832361.1 hypothetical protein HWB09_gp032 [Pectobacterium phage vB_PatP_CB4]AQT27874.1 hypothetical protein CB4_032 [Pectobacterium phage vB_PatP_CB4]ARB11756.1 hypothetical protein CB1_29 [Pectobacterium phage vB_PatP_CB1]ARB11856.1 hypothetical protein CB3_032 [Pectobacterium phage vB_PatP_CB3]
MFRTANNVNEALSEIKAHLFPYDENTVHSLVMLYHNSLLQDLRRAGLWKTDNHLQKSETRKEKK